MRRLFIVAALLVATSASAADPALKGSGGYGSSGCGLGSMLIDSRDTGLQIVSSLLNTLVFLNQTFAMTSGTSNCGRGLVSSNTRDFVEANREVLAKDMSRGQGETIGALTWMAGCSNSRAVGAVLQKNYSTIVPSEKASAQEITDRLLETLKSDKSLGCQLG
jgi:hypothetical protein